MGAMTFVRLSGVNWTFLTGIFLLFICRIYPADSVSPPTGHIQLDFEMKNSTKYSGETARLKCEITGDPIPRYRWFKGDEELKNARKYSIRPTEWGSKMRISGLEPSDTGSYTCRGENPWGSEETTGYLHVRPESNPNPQERGGGGEENLNIEIDTGFNGPDSIEYEDYIDYAPENPSDNGNQGGAGSWNDDGNEEFPRCQPYRGAACSNFLSNRNIYVTHEEEQGRIEEKLLGACMRSGMFVLCETVQQ